MAHCLGLFRALQIARGGARNPTPRGWTPNLAELDWPEAQPPRSFPNIQTVIINLNAKITDNVNHGPQVRTCYASIVTTKLAHHSFFPPFHESPQTERAQGALMPGATSPGRFAALSNPSCGHLILSLSCPCPSAISKVFSHGRNVHGNLSHRSHVCFRRPSLARSDFASSGFFIYT